VPPNGRPPSGVVPTGDSFAGGEVTPTSASTTGRKSTDGASLARTSSDRSDASYPANYGSSTASFASVASTSTSASTRRTIIPLYNLQAHNVMTNVIVDAGTDAKIAKFQKRGMELIDLAVIEPVEVWGERDKEREGKQGGLRISIDEMGAIVAVTPNKGSLASSRNTAGFLRPGTSSRPATPSAASSAVSLHSETVHIAPQPQVVLTPPASQSTHSTDATPTPSSPTPKPSLMNPSGSKRNIFGKLFNKRNATTKDSPSNGMDRVSTPNLPAFANVSMSPAKEPTTRGNPTPLRMMSPPTSPASQQTTPTQRASQTPRPTDEDPSSPTPTVAPSKGHGRNLSLTNAVSSSIRNNKNRLSAVIGDRIVKRGSRDGSPNSTIGGLHANNHSALSLAATGSRGSVDSLAQTASSHGLLPIPPAMGAQDSIVTSSPTPSRQLQLRPPILGIQPTFVSSATIPDLGSPLVTGSGGTTFEAQQQEKESKHQLAGQKALLYVWLVRKWLKRRPGADSGGILGLHLPGALLPSTSAYGKDGAAAFIQQQQMIEGLGPVEVRFEWKRARAASGKSGKRGRKSLRRGMTASQGDDNENEEKDSGEREVRKERSVREQLGLEASVDAESSRKQRRATMQVSPEEKLKLEEKKRWSLRLSGQSFSTGTTTTLSEDMNGVPASPAPSRIPQAPASPMPGGKTMDRVVSGSPARKRLSLRKDADDSGEYDAGEESDPEDSETPWICTLKIRRVGGDASSNPSRTSSSMNGHENGHSKTASNFNVGTGILRLKVGTLSPTPHHPKVVAMLKVPFPLPDVEVERMGVVKRRGVGAPPRQTYAGLTLTAEEIKDVVCSTGLWLVVREGFGGVGRVNRKGDGWRIRA
jgi:hypothetical protein